MQNHNQTLIFEIFSSDKQRHQCFLQAIGWAQQRLGFCTPPQLINCMQRKFISDVLRRNPIKHESNIHLNVYNSFYLTITHGESHGIFKSTSHRPSPYITPQHPIGAPLYFAKEALPSVASLFFLHQNPPSSFQKTRYRISISPEKPLHTLFLIFPLQTKFPFWRQPDFLLTLEPP